MGKISRTTKGIIKSDTAKEFLSGIYSDAIGALTGDPASFISLYNDLKSLPSAIRDGIFLECFQVFLLNAYEYDVQKQEFVKDSLYSFSKALAEASPNEEADYDGFPDKLTEYAKRIIKLIDDCGTIQKAYYLSCLSRAIMNKINGDPKMDTRMYFKLAQCIRNLTEEDLEFLKKTIQVGIITEDEDYIDDYVALGLLKGVNGGYEYTERAFYLKKYALDYEHKVDIPEEYSERAKPNEIQTIPLEGIDKLFEKDNDSRNQG